MTNDPLHRRRLLAAFVLTLMGIPLALAQSLARAPSRPGAAAPPVSAAAPSAVPPRLALLGPGDAVTMQVYGQPDMTTTTYVGDDGTIRVPLAGAVQVGGSTPVEASQRIEKALRDGGFFVHPQVTLTLNRSRSQRVTVLGEVRTPGSYAIDPSTSVLDLVAAAGGLTQNGADSGYVRRHEPDGRVVSYTVDLKGFGGGGHDGMPQQRLQGGDELYVPQAEHVYVYGEVTNPNMYKLDPGMTVMQAIIRAGGITPRGSERRVEIKRMGKDGQYVVSKARLDELLEPDDIVRVKESIF